ncbi:MAG: hypothetical protein MUD14_16115 [Hydrococcus sp. Prado102]|nr:hypothetical protein [Hydrococcus sp. Prado102]
MEEALKYAQLAEQKAKELWELSEEFAEKWEKRLREAEKTVASKSDD